MPPISPSKVAKLRKQLQIIPESVFDTINELIVKRFDGYSAAFTAKELAESIPNNDLSVVVDAYANNWDIEWDRPGYNESYQATITFRKRKR